MVKFSLRSMVDKQTQVVMVSSTAIALYGYDQGKNKHETSELLLALGLSCFPYF